MRQQYESFNVDEQRNLGDRVGGGHRRRIRFLFAKAPPFPIIHGRVNQFLGQCSGPSVGEDFSVRCPRFRFERDHPTGDRAGDVLRRHRPARCFARWTIRGTSPFFPWRLCSPISDRPELIVYVGGLLTIAGTYLVSYRRAGEGQVARYRSFVSFGRRDASVGIAKYSQSRA